MSSKLISRLTEFVANQTEEPSKKDLSDAMKEVFKSKKGKKTSKDGEEKQKRKPSPYNLFYAEQSAIIKKKEEDLPKEERKTAKEKMSYIAQLWKDHKSGEKFEDASDGNKSDDEEEEQPAPVAKKTETKKKPAKSASEDEDEEEKVPVAKKAENKKAAATKKK